MVVSLSDDVIDGVDDVLRPTWQEVNGRVVPESTDINLTNGAVLLDATYVYADMANSTGLAQQHGRRQVAKVVRCYLNAASRIIRHRGGAIRSFDGDRVMAIFIGHDKNTVAARAALNISWAVHHVINPKLQAKWTNFSWTMTHGVGIDTGEAMLVRGGVYGQNDIISIGGAPNIAAKLSELRGRKRIFISEAVYGKLNASVRLSANGTDMWTKLATQTFGGKSVTYYGSSYSRMP